MRVRPLGAAPVAWLLLLTACSSGNVGAPPSAPAAPALKLVGHDDLGGAAGAGKGGEGMAMVATSDGKRVLYIAAESGPACFAVVDVTDPTRPRMLKQIDVPGPNTQCNSLDLSGNLLLVANQAGKAGQMPAGLRIFDVRDPLAPKETGFFDTLGPQSRGVHHVWFVDGRYAYLSTGAADFTPANPQDDQFFMVVDLSQPDRPREVGRWWYPGTRQDDIARPPRNPGLDSGYRLHNIDVFPDYPNRAYLGYIDGGVVILDISNKQQPKPVFLGRPEPPATVGFTHTVLPLFSRRLLVVSSEATTNKCTEADKRIWTWDLKDETRPMPIAPVPEPADKALLCQAGGRFGAHNIWENRPGRLGAHSDRLVVGSFFAGGVRVYDVCDPAAPKEVAFNVPPAPPGSQVGSIQINHVYWDDRGIVYAVDRFGGGLYDMKLQTPGLTSASGCKSG